MNSPSAATRPTRSSKLAAAAVAGAGLLACVAGLKLLPWPRSVESGWAVGLLLAAGGAVANRALGSREWLPDAGDARSMAAYAGGALATQAVFHLAASWW